MMEQKKRRPAILDGPEMTMEELEEWYHLMMEEGPVRSMKNTEAFIEKNNKRNSENFAK